MVHLPPDLTASFLAHVTLFKLSLAQQHNFSLRELLVLVFLGTWKEAAPKRLHRFLSIPKSAVTGVIDKLAARGMVKRRQSEQDRRIWLVALTPQGKCFTGLIKVEETRIMQAALEGLSEEEQKGFLRALEILQGQLAPTQPLPKPTRKGRAAS